MKKEVSITLSELDIRELICEKYKLDIKNAKLKFNQQEVGDDRFGPTEKKTVSITVSSTEHLK